MSRYMDALAQAKWIIKCQYGLTAASMVIAVLAMTGWRNSPKDFTAHIPPSLTGGAKIKIGRNEVPDPNVYIFAFYVWQQVYRWSANGQKDYGDQIFKLQAFFTPACQEQLKNDLSIRAKNGELDQRTRAIMEIPGLGYSEDRVITQADGSWNVLVDTQVLETSRGIPVKDAFIRYPLHVVRYDIDRELNPWQLAIDCYAKDARPERLDPKAVEITASTKGGVVKNSSGYASPDAAEPAVPAKQASSVAVPSTTPSSVSATRQAVPAPLAPVTLPHEGR